MNEEYLAFLRLNPDEAAEELAMARERFELFVAETLENSRDKVDPQTITTMRAALKQWHDLNVRDAAAMAKRRAQAGKRPN